jgi:hypothetical protein
VCAAAVHTLLCVCVCSGTRLCCCLAPDYCTVCLQPLVVFVWVMGLWIVRVVHHAIVLYRQCSTAHSTGVQMSASDVCEYPGYDWCCVSTHACVMWSGVCGIKHVFLCGGLHMSAFYHIICFGFRAGSVPVHAWL